MDTPRLSPDEVAIDGLSFRTLLPADDDYDRLAQLITASNVADGIEYAPTGASLRNEYEHTEHFDAAQDVVLAEADGQLIGYGQSSRQVRDGRPTYWSSGTVLQGYRRRGLGRAILRANEARSRARAVGFPDDEGRVFASWIDDKEGGARELLESAGYRPRRYGFTMRLVDLAAVPDVPLPEGLELRPVTEDQHRAIFDADNEAFRDHWGHREYSDEDFAGRFAEPELDTSLWRVAWEGDEVAGSVLAYIWKAENETLGVQRGWLEHISVRRPWRRRGVARALIASAVHGLRAAGMTEVMLGVDSENLTGALGLYESMGFGLVDRGTYYEKPFDPADGDQQAT